MTTADIVTVELQAIGDQHDKSLENSAKVFAEEVLKIINSANTMADKVDADFARVATSARKNLADMGQVIGQLHLDKLNPMGGVVGQLNIDAQKVKQPVATITAELAKVGNSANRNFQLQNAAFQLQDFFVQVAGGQGILRPLAQQLPQLLGGLGLFGAAAGIAASALGVLIPALGGFESAADKAKDAQAAFDIAMRSTKGLFDANQQAALEYVSSLGLVEQGLLNVAKVRTGDAVQQNTDALKAQSDELKSYRNQITALVTDIKMSSNGAIKPDPGITDTYNQLNELVNSGKATAEQYNALIPVVQAAGPAFAAQGFDVAGLVTKLADAAESSKNLENNQGVLKATQDALNESTQTLTVSIGTWVGEVSRAGSSVNSLTSDLIKLMEAQQAAQQANQLKFDVGSADFGNQLAGLQATTDAYKSGKSAVEQHTRDVAVGTAQTKAFNDAMEAGSSIFEANAKSLIIANAAGEAFDSKKTYDAQQAAAKKSAGASDKLAAKQDNAITKLSQETLLNQQLIAVWGQGAAAQAEVKAQYDAVNSARQVGIKETDTEYKSYIDNYKAAALVNEQSKTRLADLKAGQTLTESVMTSQEKYNLAVSQYGTMLAAGTISLETYHRAIKAADEENTGFKTGLDAIGQSIQGGIQGATSFSDAILKIVLSLGQLIAQAALFGNGPLSGIFNALTGTVGGLIGGFKSSGGSPIPGAITAAANVLAIGSGGGKAGGGQVSNNKSYWVGENGPEPFIPSVPGTIIPNGQGLGGGGTKNVVTFYINATGDRQIAAAAAEAGQRAYKQAMRDQPGNLIKFNKRKN